MSCELLGDDFRLFWDSDPTPVVDCHGNTIGYGNWDDPVWKEQISIGDLGFDFAIEQVEIPLRIDTKVYKPGRADWTLTFNANYNANVPIETVAANQEFFDRLIQMIGTKGCIHMALGDGNNFTTGNANFNLWEAWWTITGNLGGALDTNAAIDVEARVHHWRGENDNQLPRFVPGTSPT